MAAKETYLTRAGLDNLEAELEHLRTARRHDVADRIQRAKELGGTVDNAEYDEAKNEQAFVEGRIRTLEAMINNAVIIPSDRAPSETVQVGSHVTVVNQSGESEDYTIVGSAEADPLKGNISNESPVGKALLGCRVGEEVEVPTPRGSLHLTIQEIT